VIGAGEIAIADARSTEPSVPELARLVRDAYAGGLLSGKAGVTHFHVGNGNARMSQLRTLLDDYEIAPGLHDQRIQFSGKGRWHRAALVPIIASHFVW